MNALLLLVILSGAVTLWALWRMIEPFLEDPEEQIRFEALDEELGRIEELVARKSVVLQTLRDIEFDHNTGKLSDEDYERLKRKHEVEGVRIMRELDDLRGGVDVDDEIDSELEARLEDVTASEPEPTGAPEIESVHCPSCGKELEPESRFCNRCGTEITDDSSESDRASADADSEIGESGDGDSPSVSSTRETSESSETDADVSETSFANAKVTG